MKKAWIAVIVIAVLAVAASIGVLTWWLLRPPYVTVRLTGSGYGDVEQSAGFASIRNVGDMFWWFYPAQQTLSSSSRPVIVWLDGVTGVPPSLSANLGMFGPYTYNGTRREDTWANDYNLLFIDAPLGTGFSIVSGNNLPEPKDYGLYLLYTIESFYSQNPQYTDSPLYIFGQGHGAQLALSLAEELHEANTYPNFRGIVLGNGIINPVTALTQLGFYLYEMGYVDEQGREKVEALSKDVHDAALALDYKTSFEKFMTLEQVINEEASAYAVNIGHIIEKLTQDSTQLTGQKEYLKQSLKINGNLNNFMDEVVAPALGIYSDYTYDSSRNAVEESFGEYFMGPTAQAQLDHILSTTELTVTIYNGNLDAVSNTPGQIEWLKGLSWSGMEEFLNSPREALVLDRLLEGYFRVTPRLQFYWVNVAGVMAPLDNPKAVRRILARTAGY